MSDMSGMANRRPVALRRCWLFLPGADGPALLAARQSVAEFRGSTEDMAAALGARRSKAGIELAYARQRLHLECTAASVVSVDCPYTFADDEGGEADARYARQLGFVAKSAVDPRHV